VTPPEQPQQQTPPPEPTKPTPPSPAEVANFAGQWWVRTSTGLVEQFNIQQQGAVGGGSYSDQLGTGGQFAASVTGNTMVVQWTNNRGYTGVGTFTMHADGKSFDGQFGVGSIPPFQQMPIYAQPGTWESFVPEPAAPAPDLDMGGCSSCNPVDKPDPVH
jgi:hypothetical protein